MSGLIKEEDLAAVRERANIVDIVQGYVSLKKAGRSYKGLCPFHKEKTPSFVVDPEKQLFHCFGCEEGGNVFNFIMKVDHIDFGTAVETLAKKIGYNLTYVSSPEAKKRKSRKDQIYKINEEATTFYHEQLMKSKKAHAARDYLNSRDFGQKTAKEFSLGYAPSDNPLIEFFLKKGLKTSQLSDAGLISEGRKGQIDRFRNRIIFPIDDIKGNWIGLGGRVLNPDQQPKYINSPETPVFSKGKNFYNLKKAKAVIVKDDYAIVVEGYTDVIALHNAGFKNSVATLVTALTEDHLSLLSRFTSNIYLTFDSDEAGAKAAERTLSFSDQSSADIYICILPKGYDPADYVQKFKKDKFKKLLKESKTLMEFCIDRTVTQTGLKTAREKENTLGKCFELISKVSNSVTRQEYLKYLSEKTNIDLNLLITNFNNKTKTQPKDETSQTKVQADPRYNAELELLKALLNKPQLISNAKQNIEINDFSNEDLVSIYTMITSTKITEPSQFISTIENKNIRKITSKLFMSPLTDEIDNERYIEEICASIKKFNLDEKINEIKNRLEKMNPEKTPKKYDNMFKELVELEAQKRKLSMILQGK